VSVGRDEAADEINRWVEAAVRKGAKAGTERSLSALG
jgi:hypothetical protein